MKTARLIKQAVVDRLKAWPAFASVPTFTDYDRNLAGTADAVVKNAESSKGAFVVVSSSSVKDWLPNVTLGPNQIFIAVEFFEDKYVNLGNSGTGLTGDDYLTDAKELLKNWRIDNLAWLHDPQIINDGNADAMNTKRITRMVITANDQSPEAPISKVVKPAVSVTEGMATITSGTGGVEIYFTLNPDVYPSSIAGTLYTAPFAVVAGDVITACAYLAGAIPSDITKKTV